MSAKTAEKGRTVAAALLVTPDGRYLMQLRDDVPRILLPGHWACFGGAIEPGETPEAAMRRELAEEIEFRARELAAFTEMQVRFPVDPPRWDHMHFFAVPILASDIDRMVLHEGQGKALFTPEALAAESRVAPWDLAAVLMHARRRALFPR
ncbi:MAG TPA: NUDIX domain-containing protein [Stellaceae bacterium]|nr:NUDIX domain-containing protein [Stellaceae bacterium]